MRPYAPPIPAMITPFSCLNQRYLHSPNYSVPLPTTISSVTSVWGGLESIVADDGSVRPESQIRVDIIRCVAAAIPLLLKYQGTGKIHAVIQEGFMKCPVIGLGWLSGTSPVR